MVGPRGSSTSPTSAKRRSSATFRLQIDNPEAHNQYGRRPRADGRPTAAQGTPPLLPTWDSPSIRRSWRARHRLGAAAVRHLRRSKAARGRLLRRAHRRQHRQQLRDEQPAFVVKRREILWNRRQQRLLRPARQPQRVDCGDIHGHAHMRWPALFSAHVKAPATRASAARRQPSPGAGARHRPRPRRHRPRRTCAGCPGTAVVLAQGPPDQRPHDHLACARTPSTQRITSRRYGQSPAPKEGIVLTPLHRLGRCRALAALLHRGARGETVREGERRSSRSRTAG